MPIIPLIFAANIFITEVSTADIDYQKSSALINEIIFDKNSQIEIQLNEAGCSPNKYQIKFNTQILQLKKLSSSQTPFCIYKTVPNIPSSSGSLTLYDGNNRILDYACWNTSPPDNQPSWQGKCIKSTISSDDSLSRHPNSRDTNQALDWDIALHPTLGQANQKINQPPHAQISYRIKKNPGQSILQLNAANSSDPDSDKLEMTWQVDSRYYFGPQLIISSFDPSVSHLITLTVSDPFYESSQDTIEIPPAPKKSSSAKKTLPLPSNQPSKQIIFSEIFSNPIGKDEHQEWIEIYNASAKTINLQNWYIQDANKPQNIEKIFYRIDLASQNYYKVSLTNLKLTNTGSEIFLIDAHGHLSDKINFPAFKEGQSYAKIALFNAIKNNHSENWEITPNPTPGIFNPRRYQIQAVIISHDTLNYRLVLQTSKHQFSVSYLNLHPELAAQLFIPASQIEAIIESQNAHYILKKFQILKSPPQKENHFPEPIKISLILSSLVIYSASRFKKNAPL